MGIGIDNGENLVNSKNDQIYNSPYPKKNNSLIPIYFFFNFAITLFFPKIALFFIC